MKHYNTNKPDFAQKFTRFISFVFAMIAFVTFISLFDDNTVTEVEEDQKEYTTFAYSKQMRAWVQIPIYDIPLSELHNDEPELPPEYIEPVLPPENTVEVYDPPEEIIQEQIIEDIVEEEVYIPTPEEIVMESLGNNTIETELGTFTKYSLPTEYYPNLNFSKFQAWMPYTAITAKGSSAYKVVHDARMYIDEFGLCRFEVSEDQFSINNTDDYIVAMGTFYKTKGICGERFLIITSTGAYTAITGDEKDDHDTDSHNMFTHNSDGSCNGIVEFLVDKRNLNKDIKLHGTVTMGPIEPLQGTIEYIYKIS